MVFYSFLWVDAGSGKRRKKRELLSLFALSWFTFELVRPLLCASILFFSDILPGGEGVIDG